MCTSVPQTRFPFPGRGRSAARVTALLLGCALGGCITSPVWEYGSTRQARQTQLGSCPNGLLDAAEDGDTQIVEVAGRDGYWFAFADQWGTTLKPDPFATSPGGPRDSKHMARIHGQLASSGDSLYAGMGFAFTNPKTPYELSDAKGVRFWAKGPGKVRVKIPDRNTAPEGDRCTDCYNDFGVDLYLQDEWVRYTVPFSEMRQQPGWGDRAPALDTEGVFAVQWQYSTPGGHYDISIDDVELVGCAEAEAR